MLTKSIAWWSVATFQLRVMNRLSNCYISELLLPGCDSPHRPFINLQNVNLYRLVTSQPQSHDVQLCGNVSSSQNSFLKVQNLSFLFFDSMAFTQYAIQAPSLTTSKPLRLSILWRAFYKSLQIIEVIIQLLQSKAMIRYYTPAYAIITCQGVGRHCTGGGGWSGNLMSINITRQLVLVKSLAQPASVCCEIAEGSLEK